MIRRAILKALAASLLTAAGTTRAQSPGQVGILLLHGKNPGSPRDPNFTSVMYRLNREGFLTAMPDMPWSASRYLDGDWSGAMQEVASHVAALRSRGAAKVIIAGHSMGCPAAMSHAARGGSVDALVLYAPGHSPYVYWTWPVAAAVRRSIESARAMVAAGKGDETGTFFDLNQGRELAVRTTARKYLSFFDPESEAEMSVTAPKLPATLPVLTVVGLQDPLYRTIRPYLIDRMPANPNSRFIEVAANHLGTPEAGLEQTLRWISDIGGAA